MKKITKISLAVLAGIEMVFYIITPILIGLLWVKTFPTIENTGNYIIYSIALVSSIFRGIKSGWIKK